MWTLWWYPSVFLTYIFSPFFVFFGCVITILIVIISASSWCASPDDDDRLMRLHFSTPMVVEKLHFERENGGFPTEVWLFILKSLGRYYISVNPLHVISCNFTQFSLQLFILYTLQSLLRLENTLKKIWIIMINCRLRSPSHPSTACLWRRTERATRPCSRSRSDWVGLTTILNWIHLFTVKWNEWLCSLNKLPICQHSET